MNLFNFPKYKINKPIKLIELFAGVGSQAMALRNIKADFEHHKVVEFDKYAIASYNAIHGTDFPVTDITKINGDFLDITDTENYCYLMTYSFPCTDLSIAGKQMGMKKGSGTRSGLLWEVERLLNETKELPQVLVMENVTEVHSEKNKSDFDKWIEFLKGKGYINFWKDLNSKNYGVAQNRERCFMVSFLSSEYQDYNFPSEQKLNKTVMDYLENNVDEKFYIDSEKSKKLILDLSKKDILPTKTMGVSLEKTNGNVGFKSINDATIRLENTAHTITSRYWKGMSGNGDNGIIVVGKLNHFSAMDLGNRVYSTKGIAPACTAHANDTLAKILVKQATNTGYAECKINGVVDLSYPDSKTRRGRVQDNGYICPTLTAQNNEICKIESQYRIRKLTPRECWRLMGFTDEDFNKAAKVNSNTQLYKQAGNSIVVNCLEGIFENLIK